MVEGQLESALSVCASECVFVYVCVPESWLAHNLSRLMGFENYLAQMTIMKICQVQELFCQLKGQCYNPLLNLVHMLQWNMFMSGP